MQRKLAPGEPGTKKYLEKYGDRFVCLRYKYDTESGIKSKTIELTVSEEVWTKKSNYIPPNKLMHLNIPLTNVFLQKLVREAGGFWDSTAHCLRLPYNMTKALGLETRIIWSLSNK